MPRRSVGMRWRLATLTVVTVGLVGIAIRIPWTPAAPVDASAGGVAMPTCAAVGRPTAASLPTAAPTLGVASKVVTLSEQFGAPLVTPDGRFAFIGYARQLDSAIGVFSLAGGTPHLIRTIPIVQQPQGLVLSPDGRELIVATVKGLVVVDAARAELGGAAAVLGLLAVPGTSFGYGRLAFSPDGRFIFEGVIQPRQIDVVNLGAALRDHFRAHGYNVGAVPVGAFTYGIAASPDGRYLFATNYSSAAASSDQPADGALITIDLKKAERTPATSVISSVLAGCGTNGIATTGQTVFVTAEGSGVVLAYSAAALVHSPASALIAKVAVGSGPANIISIDDGSELVVLNTNFYTRIGNTTLAILRARSRGLALVGDVDAAPGSFAVSASRDGSRSLVTAIGSNQFESFDLSAQSLASASVAHASVAGATGGNGTTPPPSNATSVWLCRPGLPADPCATNLARIVTAASGSTSVVHEAANPSAKFDCFFVYGTVSPEPSMNADLKVQEPETHVTQQVAPFSDVCRVYAPIYRQVTEDGAATGGLGAGSPGVATAYASLRAGFEEYLKKYNDGRPFILIGHSQGAGMLILLMERLIDDDPTLRSRFVMAIVPGGNVVVPTGKDVGGSFSHIPLCTRAGESGCVVAFSTFPSAPPIGSYFGRPGQGISLMSGQVKSAGLMVACTNPAALSGGRALLDPYLPATGLSRWSEYPGLYAAECEQHGGASWLQVSKATGASDHRPVVTETQGVGFGYHADDVNLALGNLVTDVGAAETGWSASH